MTEPATYTEEELLRALAKALRTAPAHQVVDETRRELRRRRGPRLAPGRIRASDVAELLRKKDAG